ncbi:MAG: metallophosphoesterase [Clostridioides sp.]|jgi:2',3'-cyclic-nucleotide 2'-phosphodiesterase (5'-nucleotidase family)|nr:metallophosphoesterase [Clostridioides sp.]
MKNKKRILIATIFFILAFISYMEYESIDESIPDAEVNVLATSDLHGNVPDELVDYIQKKRASDPNLITVDGGDFWDAQTTEMKEWVSGKKLIGLSLNGPEYSTISAPYTGNPPFLKSMLKINYDAVVLGNHEFLNEKPALDKVIAGFGQNNVPVLSANIYKNSGGNYVKPYVVKNIKTKKGKLKVGILGLTIREVGERDKDDDDPYHNNQYRYLQNQDNYRGKLYANDVISEAKKWVKMMNSKEKPDLIIAVVHSGEKAKVPKNPGNVIGDLAESVSGIDAIVAAHTHKYISEHNYTAPDGRRVVVTQPGDHGEYLSSINIKLEKRYRKWEVIYKHTAVKNFESVDVITASRMPTDTNEGIYSQLENLSYDSQYRSVLVDNGNYLDTATPLLNSLYSKYKDKTLSLKDSEKVFNYNQYIFFNSVILGVDNIDIASDSPWNDKEFRKYLRDKGYYLDITTISSNILDKSSGKPHNTPYTINVVSTKEGSIRIGILGVTLDSVGTGFSTSTTSNSLTIVDPAKNTDKYVREMKSKGSDIVVIVLNSGKASDGKIDKSIIDICNSSKEIDAIVTQSNSDVDSSVSRLKKQGGEVCIVKTSATKGVLSKLHFEVDEIRGKWQVRNIVPKFFSSMP